MKLDNILQLFVVKEKKFFPLFSDSAKNILKAADLLLQQAKEEDHDKRIVFAHRIKECETAGDTITDKIIDELLDSYVTPFDSFGYNIPSIFCIFMTNYFMSPACSYCIRHFHFRTN